MIVDQRTWRGNSPPGHLNPMEYLIRLMVVRCSKYGIQDRRNPAYISDERPHESDLKGNHSTTIVSAYGERMRRIPKQKQLGAGS